MLYLAVSVAHGCDYSSPPTRPCARVKGMTQAEYLELVAIIGMASETNRMVAALQVPIDEIFLEEG